MTKLFCNSLLGVICKVYAYRRGYLQCSGVRMYFLTIWHEMKTQSSARHLYNVAASSSLWAFRNGSPGADAAQSHPITWAVGFWPGDDQEGCLWCTYRFITGIQMSCEYGNCILLIQVSSQPKCIIFLLVRSSLRLDFGKTQMKHSQIPKQCARADCQRILLFHFKVLLF